MEHCQCLFSESRDNVASLSLAKSKLMGGSLHFKLLFKTFAYELCREKYLLTIVRIDSYLAGINNYYTSLEVMINIYNQATS